jgi:hypothetical protein
MDGVDSAAASGLDSRRDRMALADKRSLESLFCLAARRDDL